MKGAAIATRFAAGRRQFRFRLLGLAQSKFRRDGEVGVEFGIVAINAREKMFGQLHGREFSRAEQSRQFSDGQKGEVGLRHEARNLTQARRYEVQRWCQNIFSWRRKFPNVPRLAMMKATRNWFSVRTWPRLMRRYSSAMPQQPPL